MESQWRLSRQMGKQLGASPIAIPTGSGTNRNVKKACSALPESGSGEPASDHRTVGLKLDRDKNLEGGSG
ncbi:uncharacterized protein An07g05680 [Aspergillus niger]|uniref:Contig An07c0160, genomic contig n=2 Tax=Aspergillus niger TaxID=5061 RepID=E2PSQ5_ASPNC|nr:uncharacterized protein An07g05680 [Aspergillus niger]CAK48939.1 unnamed protein product [Aspergillus niger]